MFILLMILVNFSSLSSQNNNQNLQRPPYVPNQNANSNQQQNMQYQENGQYYQNPPQRPNMQPNYRQTRPNQNHQYYPPQQQRPYPPAPNPYYQNNAYYPQNPYYQKPQKEVFDGSFYFSLGAPDGIGLNYNWLINKNISFGLSGGIIATDFLGFGFEPEPGDENEDFNALGAIPVFSLHLTFYTNISDNHRIFYDISGLYVVILLGGVGFEYQGDSGFSFRIGAYTPIIFPGAYDEDDDYEFFILPSIGIGYSF